MESARLWIWASNRRRIPVHRNATADGVHEASLAELVYDEVAVGGVEVFNWLSRFVEAFYIATQPEKPREVLVWDASARSGVYRFLRKQGGDGGRSVVCGGTGDDRDRRVRAFAHAGLVDRRGGRAVDRGRDLRHRVLRH